jgi:hypothetical protein
MTLSEFACLAFIMPVVRQGWDFDGSFVSGAVGWYLIQDVGDDVAELLLDQLELAVVDLGFSVLPAAQALHPIDPESKH